MVPMPEARLRVTCPYCSAEYLVIVSKPPSLRVKWNLCLFCHRRVLPTYQPAKGIETFISPQDKELL
jgi:hypothetical protein